MKQPKKEPIPVDHLYVSNPDGLNFQAADGQKSNIPEGTTLQIINVTEKNVRLAVQREIGGVLDITLAKLRRNCKPERRHPTRFLCEITLSPERREELLNELELDDDCEFRKTDTPKVIRDLMLQAVRDKLEDVKSNMTYEIDNFFRSESE